MNDILGILIVVGVFVLLGGFVGLGLAIASSAMAVPKNRTLEKIRAVLPGANCGVCGYSGCDGYAEALMEGNALPSLCIPGGDDVLSGVAKALNLDLINDVIKQTALVRCDGCSEFTSKKLLYKGMETCFAASQFYGGEWNCDYGCLGFGDCGAVCEYDAISIENGLARINAGLCRGCGVCIDVCPKSLIKLVPSKSKGVVRCSCTDKGSVVRKICKVGCIGCNRCAKVCTHDAINVTDNLAEVNYEKCVGCGDCVKVCPTGCISIFGQPADKVKIGTV